MKICNVESTKDPVLQEYINKYGQADGLRLYLKVKANPTADFSISTEEVEEQVIRVPGEKALNYLKAQLRIKQNRLNSINSDVKLSKLKEDTDEYKKNLLLKNNLLESINQLESQIKDLDELSDLKTLVDVANKQLDWVSSLFTKTEISPSEIREASKIIDMWSEMKNIMFGEDADILNEDIVNALNSIKARIDKEGMFGAWYRAAGEYVSNDSGYESPSQLLKEFYEIEDLSMFTAEWRYLGATGIRLLTYMDKVNKDAVTRINEEGKQWNKKLTAALDKVYAKGKQDLLFQDAPDGSRTGELTNRYAQAWYDANSKSKRDLYYVLKNAKEDKTRIRKAFEKRNAFLRKNTIRVDTRFFDNPDFITNEGVTQEMYIELLEKEYGKERTQELIRQAKENYQSYLDNLEVIKQVNQDKVENGELTQEEANNIVYNWTLKESPIVWLNQTDSAQNDVENTYSQSFDNRYVVTKPRKVIDGKESGWYDKKYEQIENDKDVLEAYMLVREYMTEMMSYLPSYITKELQVNFLPRIKQTAMVDFTYEGLKGLIAAYPQDLRESISSKAGTEMRYLEESEIGKLYKHIPTKFLTPIPVDERAKDLRQILPMFGKMALGYKHKSQIRDGIELSNEFLSKLSKSKQRKEFTDNELTNMKKSVEWFIDSQIYEVGRIDEGVSKIKLWNKELTYDIVNLEKVDAINEDYKNLLKKMDKDSALTKLKETYNDDIEILTAKEKYSRLEKKRDELEDKLYNKEITQEEYEEQIKPLEEESKSLGKNLVWSKIGDKVMRYNQAMAFWFNPFSAFNNYTFGIISNLMWSAGNVDFSPKDTMKAYGLMWKSVMNLKDKKLDKVTNLIAKFDLLYENLEFHSSETENETLKKLKNFPYLLLRKGDLFIKGQTLLSIMSHKKVKVVENGVEKEISLLEAFGDNGKWNTEKYGENTEWAGDWTNKEHNQAFLDFKRYQGKIQVKLHGNFDPTSTPAFKKHILKRMLGQFRASWMVEGFAQRFEKRVYDRDLDRNIEGRYRTIGSLGFAKTMKVFGKLVAKHFNGKIDLSMLPAKDRDIVLENMQKNLAEIYLYAAMLSVYFILKAGLDDDDDDANTKMALNMLNRIMADTTFYLSPNTFISIVKDPIPVLSIPIRAMRGINSAVDLVIDDELTESEEEQKWRNITSNFYVINQYNKLYNMQNKVFN